MDGIWGLVSALSTSDAAGCSAAGGHARERFSQPDDALQAERRMKIGAQEVVLDVGGCRQDMDQLLAQMRLLRIGSKNCARTMWDFS